MLKCQLYLILCGGPLSLSVEKNKKLSQKQLRTGDCVLLKRDKSLKTHQTPHHTNPYEVTQVKGTMITATDGTLTVTRNASYFKKVEHLKNSKDVKPQVEPWLNWTVMITSQLMNKILIMLQDNQHLYLQDHKETEDCQHVYKITSCDQHCQCIIGI